MLLDAVEAFHLLPVATLNAIGGSSDQPLHEPFAHGGDGVEREVPGLAREPVVDKEDAPHHPDHQQYQRGRAPEPHPDKLRDPIRQVSETIIETLTHGCKTLLSVTKKEDSWATEAWGREVNPVPVA